LKWQQESGSIGQIYCHTLKLIIPNIHPSMQWMNLPQNFWTNQDLIDRKSNKC